MCNINIRYLKLPKLLKKTLKSFEKMMIDTESTLAGCRITIDKDRKKLCFLIVAPNYNSTQYLAMLHRSHIKYNHIYVEDNVLFESNSVKDLYAYVQNSLIKQLSKEPEFSKKLLVE